MTCPPTSAQRIAEHLARDHPERFGRDLQQIERDIQNIIDTARLIHMGRNGVSLYHKSGKTVKINPEGTGTMVNDPNKNWFVTQQNYHPA